MHSHFGLALIGPNWLTNGYGNEAPPLSRSPNNGCYRHVWRLGERDFCPDLLGYNPPNFGHCDDTLEF